MLCVFRYPEIWMSKVAWSVGTDRILTHILDCYAITSVAIEWQICGEVFDAINGAYRSSAHYWYYNFINNFNTFNNNLKKKYTMG